MVICLARVLFSAFVGHAGPPFNGICWSRCNCFVQILFTLRQYSLSDLPSSPPLTFSLYNSLPLFDFPGFPPPSLPSNNFYFSLLSLLWFLFIARPLHTPELKLGWTLNLVCLILSESLIWRSIALLYRAPDLEWIWGSICNPSSLLFLSL